MGKRRIRNLQYLNAGEIIGFDPRVDRTAEVKEKYGVQTHLSFDDAMGKDPDVLIISTPPELHMQYAKAALTEGKHFFCEVGVGSENADELIQLTQYESTLAALSCTFRFNPIVQKIKNIVDNGDIGGILTFSSHSGQYLPDWHPWEDYRSFWASQRNTGACREQFVLEAIWLTWVLGPFQEISCLKDKLTTLDTDIDDVYQMLVRLKRGAIGHLMLDVLSRVPYRTGRFFGSDGIIQWSLTDQQIRIYSVAEKRWREFTESEDQVEAGYIHAERMYIDEMRHFINALQGKEKWIYPLAEEREIQRALEAADRSAKTGRHMKLENGD